MKNLKKVLALVLAFACAFTMFAGAAFTDSADIQQTEAVEMLSALGVINGYTDGSFKPNDTIFRAEAAKMIYTIRNGGNDDATAFEGKSVFTDVYSGHWAEGYINFCYTNGIINGKGNSKFAPDDKVTGTELAKMLLICMGYQADKSGLTGTGYTQRTNALASQNGLYNDVTASVTAAMPRQYAAQIMYNALKADTVAWSADIGDYQKVTTTGLELRETSAGQYQWVSVTKNETMGKKWMKLDDVNSGIVTAVEKENGKDTYKVTTTGGTYSKVATDYTNLMGQAVKVMMKDGEKDQVYGIYADEDSKVIATGLVGALEADGDKIKVDGTSYKVDATALALNVYAANDDTNTVSLAALAAISSGSQVAKAANGQTVAASIKLIDNDGDGKIDRAVYVPTIVGKVTSVTSTAVNVNIASVGQMKFADDDIYEGVAKNDFAAYVADDYMSSGLNTLTKLDKISAKAEATRGSGAAQEVRIDGEWYKTADDMGVATVTTGNTYDFFVVGKFIVSAEETAGDSTTIGYISAIDNKADGTDLDMITGESTGTLSARMYFQDGTNAVVKISKVDGKKINNTGTTSDEYKYDDSAVPQAGFKGMVTYSKLSDGTYDIKKVDSTNEAGLDWVASLTATDGSSIYYKQKISGMSILDDAVIFVQTGKETKVLTGAQVKNWADQATGLTFTTGASAVLTKESNGISYVKVAALVAAESVAVPGATNDTKYAYLTGNSYIADKNGEKKVAYDVWTGTEATTLFEDSGSNPNYAAGKVISYNVNGDYIENVVVNPGFEAAIVGFDGKAEGELKFYMGNGSANIRQYSLDADCVFIAVDDKNNKGMEGGLESVPGSAESNTADSAYYTNARIVLNSDNDVVAVIYDLENNKMASNTLYSK